MGRRGMNIGYWWEIQKEGDHQKDQGVGGWNNRDWINLAQNRDQWRALVNTVMNLRVS
jgi:hypothetical protein